MPPKSIASYFKPASGAAAGTPAARNRTTPSAAARKAAMDAKDKDNKDNDEPPAKRAKVAATTTAGRAKKGAAVIPQAPTVTIPRAQSRAELRKALEAHPKVLPLLELELDTLGEDWLLALQDELTKPYFLSLKEFLIKEQSSKKVFPPAEDIYSWSRLCPLKDVRVIIVGQDPYHDDGQAHGLAFSVRKGVRIPPSLRNIYKEMGTAVNGFVVPTHGDLTEWAKHGVLLLNTSLTVRAHEAGSHSKAGWDQFTLAALGAVTDYMAGSPDTPGANGLVLMAWGAHAQNMIAGLNTTRHLVLKSAHPSPLSVRKFWGNEHFAKSNSWLRERYGTDGGIDWKSLGA
ncbi:uracil DNA glycosylase [Apiotrichum porosum]|uniref:Uracil-DNA glycosylase n=1 Tax=Apiotrichum porosum TaxID=105984 RepID=A0A427Y9H9_9TREE|nr:uracil DNA glycosylase [Apiotrichum porosum]RSH87763.1 uracil DNA glycosylase [Apiotrichum porosum]